MINYKLALALKNAGFKQKPKSEYPLYIVGKDKEPLQVPTLSKLIEEIEGFRSLHISGQEWEACSVFTCAIGKEKDISVAKLWLKSNETKK